MHKIFKSLAGFFAVMVVSLTPTLVASPSYAQSDYVDCGSKINLNSGADDCKISGNASGNKIEGVIKTVINILSAIVGAVSVIMIIIGGFKYVTSNGDSNNVSSAKNTILYAIVGLIIVAFAQVIVQFVLERT